MRIEFDRYREESIPAFNGGRGITHLKKYEDKLNTLLYGRLEPGASVGMHKHDTSSEIIYIIKGNGKVFYDETTEMLPEGSCHYCPKGHRHSLVNNGSTTLEFLAVVPEQ